MVDLAALQSEEGVEITSGVRVRLRSLADYRQNPENPVSHTPHNLGVVIESIQKVGAARSGLAADDIIYAGNLTWEGMAVAGIEGIVEVTTDGTKWVMVNRPDLTAEQRKQAAHGDQWSAMLAEMDVDQLLADIEAGVNLDGIYSEFDLEAILGEALVEAESGEAPEAQMDRAGELQEKWQVQRGQIWEIPSKTVEGQAHWLMCGDSLDTEDVSMLMDGKKAKLTITSPPYWVGKEYEKEKSWAEVVEFIYQSVVSMTKNTTHRIVINTGAPPAAHLTGERAHIRLLLDDWQRALAEEKWLLRYVRIWAKRGGLAHTAPSSDCIDQHWEFIGVFYLPKNFEGQRRCGEPWATDGIWDDIQGEMSSHGHIAAFPIEIPRRNIILYTDEGDIVADWFLGSGTTIVSCEQERRIGFGMDIEPRWCAVTLQRLSDMGLKCKLLE